LKTPTEYRGRLAPSPTGYLHLGHARTFWIAAMRARDAGGALVFRNDDLDAARYRMDFATAMFEDMRWLGLAWDEGPDVGGPHAPYSQSERLPLYRAALERLRAAGAIYPCARTRRDVMRPRARPTRAARTTSPCIRRRSGRTPGRRCHPSARPVAVNWRLRVADGEVLEFDDGRLGPRRAVAGRDFGTSRSGARTTARATSSPARWTTR